MITIKEKEVKSKKSGKPYYRLIYKYMIGDANGDTSETVRVSIDNPYLERYYTLLNSLKPTTGHWGVMLEGEKRLHKHVVENQITEDDYNFLVRMMFVEDYDDEEFLFKVPVVHEKHADEFFDGVRAETEYSFLVFQGLDLYYIDEFGEEHETIIK